MNLLPLGELILQRPRPEGTLSLIPAFQDHAAEMVASYVFTDTIRRYFGEILNTVAIGRGQGFWIQAEYGAGKTHFLAVLAALLANQGNPVWDGVQDEEIRRYRQQLQEARLFPVIVSLRGMGDADSLTEHTLLDVIIEEGFQRALEHARLDGRVRLTAAEDYIRWLEHETSSAVRQDVEAYVRSQTKQTGRDYRQSEGADALAQLIHQYCQKNAIGPRIAANVKDRLAHIFRQITGLSGPRYNGLLVVIDEYEGWEKMHRDPGGRARDEDVLETLAYLLPRDLGLQVYTIVASQSTVPAKLRGGTSRRPVHPHPAPGQRANSMITM